MDDVDETSSSIGVVCGNSACWIYDSSGFIDNQVPLRRDALRADQLFIDTQLFTDTRLFVHGFRFDLLRLRGCGKIDHLRLFRLHAALLDVEAGVQVSR